MIKGIGHIGICVSDLQSTLDSLCQTFGLEKPQIKDFPDKGVRVAVLPMGAVSVEFIEDYGGKSLLAGDIARKGNHINHFCLLADDIENDVADLKQKGVKMLVDQPQTGLRGKKIAFIAPGVLPGIPIEISEP